MFRRKNEPPAVEAHEDPAPAVVEAVVVEAPAVEVPPVTLTADEVDAWRSSVLHAGHGAYVPPEVRGPLVEALGARRDLVGLATLARTRPASVEAPRCTSDTEAHTRAAWNRKREAAAR